MPSSARCTDAEATAGLIPLTSSSVVAVTPNAMPRAPSTSWAPKPTRMKTSKVCTVVLRTVALKEAKRLDGQREMCSQTLNSRDAKQTEPGAQRRGNAAQESEMTRRRPAGAIGIWEVAGATTRKNRARQTGRRDGRPRRDRAGADLMSCQNSSTACRISPLSTDPHHPPRPAAGAPAV